MTMDSFIMTFVMIYLCILAVIFILGLASYLLRGFGMYWIAGYQKVNNPWLAFIPYGRTWLQGELSGTLHFKKRSIKNPGIWMIVLPFIYSAVFGVVYMVTVFGSLMNLANTYGSVSGANLTTEVENGMMNGSLTGQIVGMLVGGSFAVLIAVFFGALISTLRVLVNHQIYGKYTAGNVALVHAVLGLFIPLYDSICLFVYGRKAKKLSQESSGTGESTSGYYGATQNPQGMEGTGNATQTENSVTQTQNSTPQTDLYQTSQNQDGQDF